MATLGRAATWFSARSRRQKGMFVRQYMRDNRLGSVLFVGSGGAWDELAHIVERAAAEEARFVVAADLHTHIDAPWPYVRCDGLFLPFRPQSFDLILSNAVIEHVGDEADQALFTREHLRVGRHFIITTPNRRFPVESHTRKALLHWSRRWRGRNAVHFTRLLSRQELRRLVPLGTRIKGGLLGATLTAAGASPQSLSRTPLS